MVVKYVKKFTTWCLQRTNKLGVSPTNWAYLLHVGTVWKCDVNYEAHTFYLVWWNIICTLAGSFTQRVCGLGRTHYFNYILYYTELCHIHHQFGYNFSAHPFVKKMLLIQVKAIRAMQYFPTIEDSSVRQTLFEVQLFLLLYF